MTKVISLGSTLRKVMMSVMVASMGLAMVGCSAGDPGENSGGPEYAEKYEQGFESGLIEIHELQRAALTLLVEFDLAYGGPFFAATAGILDNAMVMEGMLNQHNAIYTTHSASVGGVFSPNTQQLFNNAKASGLTSLSAALDASIVFENHIIDVIHRVENISTDSVMSQNLVKTEGDIYNALNLLYSAQ